MRPQDSAEKPSLPVQRAFVVQFRAEADVEGGRFEGRVEHVVSGQASLFHSLEELLSFMASVLIQVLPRPAGDREGAAHEAAAVRVAAGKEVMSYEGVRIRGLL
jgi:hypothetical protein